jgi:hypothetical protein
VVHSYRGGTQLWAAGSSVAQNAKSKYAYIGPGPYVVVYIDGTLSSHAGTFKVQVAGIATNKPGLNETDGTTDGGLTWYDYNGATSLAVAAGGTIAFDLSPFGPSLIRLVRTDATGTDVFSAIVTTNGPS